MTRRTGKRPDPTRTQRLFGAAVVLTLLAVFLAIAPAPAQPATDPALRVDLNAATAHELQLLPGVGPTLARRIVADRHERGPYASVEDLQRVRGVGERTVHNLRSHATVGP